MIYLSDSKLNKLRGYACIMSTICSENHIQYTIKYDIYLL